MELVLAAHCLMARVETIFKIAEKCPAILPLIRPHQDFDVLVVMDFLNYCFRPETHDFYPQSLLNNQEGCRRKLPRRTVERPRDLREGNEGFKDPGRQGRRRPEEP